MNVWKILVLFNYYFLLKIKRSKAENIINKNETNKHCYLSDFCLSVSHIIYECRDLTNFSQLDPRNCEKELSIES